MLNLKLKTFAMLQTLFNKRNDSKQHYYFFLIATLISPVLSFHTHYIVFTIASLNLIIFSYNNAYIDRYCGAIKNLNLMAVIIILFYYIFNISSVESLYTYMRFHINLFSGLLIIIFTYVFLKTKNSFYTALTIVNFFFLLNIIIGIIQLFIPFNMIVSKMNIPDIINQALSTKKHFVPRGLFFGENPYTIFIISYFPIFLLSIKKHRFFYNTFILSIIIVLLQAADARGAYLGLFFYTLLSLLLSFKKLISFKIKHSIISFIIVLLLPFALQSFQTKTNFFKRYSNQVNIMHVSNAIFSITTSNNIDLSRKNSLSIRSMLISESIRTLTSNSKNTVSGIGAGQSTLITKEKLSKKRNKHYDNVFIHNSFLEIMLEGGVILVLLYLFAFTIWTENTIKVYKKLSTNFEKNTLISLYISLLIYILSGSITLHSIIWNYRDLFLFIALLLSYKNLANTDYHEQQPI